MLLGLSAKIYTRLQGQRGLRTYMWGGFSEKKSHCGRKETTCKNHAREKKKINLNYLYLYTSAEHFNDSFPKTQSALLQDIVNLAFAFMQMYKCWTLEYNEFLHTTPLLPDRKKFSFFTARKKKCLIQHPL